jgi:hypothetical protein
MNNFWRDFMYCITRKEMKFKDFIVPARTKCTVINKLNTTTVDAPGVQLMVSILLWDMKHFAKCLVSDVQIKDELSAGSDSSLFIGITVSTNTTNVYMDAGDKLYWDEELYGWQLKRIFGIDSVPMHFTQENNRHYGRIAKLRDVIDYMEDEFAEWVRENCEFYTLTEEDIENGDYHGDFEPGASILSDKGLDLFYVKQLEYQNKLENIGFTYDFKGGLVWD